MLETRGWFIIIDAEECIGELNVCSEHFSEDCSVNQAQIKAGFTKKLLLKMFSTMLGLNAAKSQSLNKHFLPMQ